MDEEDQENELMALESIFDGEQFICHRSTSSLASGQIHIDVELPMDFVVSVRLRSEGEGGEGTSNVDRDGATAHPNPADDVARSKANGKQMVTKSSKINYLPPITLLFTLPSNYPSHEPPLYTLQSNWLDRMTLSKICQALDAMWSTCQGTVVLFSWISLIREETLKVIGCNSHFECVFHSRRWNNNYTRSHGGSECKDTSSTNWDNKALVGDMESNSSIQPQGQRVSKSVIHQQHPRQPDQRAVFANTIVKDKEALFNFLVNYCTEREEREFKKRFHTCEVCFTDKNGADFVRLPCLHHFCRDCVKACYTTHIREGGIDAVKCLAVKCSGMPTISQVHDIVGKALFERYDQMLLQRALEMMTDLIYCPRAVCGKPVIVEPNEKLAWCSHCQYRFCSICKMGYHGVEPCRFKSDEKQKLFQEYTAGTKEERQLLEKTYGRKQLALLVESTLSEKYIETESKPCPHCKIPIEKSEGCNKMTCKCGAYFCFICSMQLDKGNPYFHFQDPSSPCYRQLFGDDERHPGGDGEDDDDDLEFSDSEDDDDDFGY